MKYRRLAALGKTLRLLFFFSFEQLTAYSPYRDLFVVESDELSRARDVYQIDTRNGTVAFNLLRWTAL